MKDLYSTFGVNIDLFQDTLWTEPWSNLRGLKRSGSIQPGMLEFNSRTVQVAKIAKFCATTGRSQRFAILEWGLGGMQKDMCFRFYYHDIFDALRLLYKRIFNCESLVVFEAEKKGTSKLDRMLDQERGVLEICEEEIIARRARVMHLEKVRADNLGDRNQWRTGLPSLPTWKKKGKIHAGKRQGSKLAPSDEKKRKTDKVQVPGSPERRVRLGSEFEESNSE